MTTETGEDQNSTHSRQRPTTRTREFLASFRGRKIFHPPLADHRGRLVGNNGDRLMVLGTDIVYNELGIRRVNRAQDADLIVIGGNGGMLERAYHIPRIFRECSQGFPDTPMCVLPSTYFYPSGQFGEEIGKRTAPLTLFCREPYSFKHLTQEQKLPDNCRVVLDRDMAFELQDGDLVRRLASTQAKHVLMVERTDVEADPAAFTNKSGFFRKALGKHVPGPIKRVLYPFVKARRASRITPFRIACEQMLAERFPALSGLPRHAGDVSNVNVCSFDDFCRLIGEAAVVFTTRLHVGILSAMTGRPTFIFGGPYHKIRGIYEHSLAGMNHVVFVPR